MKSLKNFAATLFFLGFGIVGAYVNQYYLYDSLSSGFPPLERDILWQSFGWLSDPVVTKYATARLAAWFITVGNIFTMYRYSKTGDFKMLIVWIVGVTCSITITFIGYKYLQLSEHVEAQKIALMEDETYQVLKKEVEDVKQRIAPLDKELKRLRKIKYLKKANELYMLQVKPLEDLESLKQYQFRKYLKEKGVDAEPVSRLRVFALMATETLMLFDPDVPADKKLTLVLSNGVIAGIAFLVEAVSAYMLVYAISDQKKRSDSMPWQVKGYLWLRRKARFIKGADGFVGWWYDVDIEDSVKRKTVKAHSQSPNVQLNDSSVQPQTVDIAAPQKRNLFDVIKLISAAIIAGSGTGKTVFLRMVLSQVPADHYIYAMDRKPFDKGKWPDRVNVIGQGGKTDDIVDAMEILGEVMERRRNETGQLVPIIIFMDDMYSLKTKIKNLDELWEPIHVDGRELEMHVSGANQSSRASAWGLKEKYDLMESFRNGIWKIYVDVYGHRSLGVTMPGMDEEKFDIPIIPNVNSNDKNPDISGVVTPVANPVITPTIDDLAKSYGIDIDTVVNSGIDTPSPVVNSPARVNVVNPVNTIDTINDKPPVVNSGINTIDDGDDNRRVNTVDDKPVVNVSKINSGRVNVVNVSRSDDVTADDLAQYAKTAYDAGKNGIFGGKRKVAGLLGKSERLITQYNKVLEGVGLVTIDGRRTRTELTQDALIDAIKKNGFPKVQHVN